VASERRASSIRFVKVAMKGSNGAVHPSYWKTGASSPNRSFRGNERVALGKVAGSQVENIRLEDTSPAMTKTGGMVAEAHSVFRHHARACPRKSDVSDLRSSGATQRGESRVAMHPRLHCLSTRKTWMAGTSPAMTKVKASQVRRLHSLRHRPARPDDPVFQGGDDGGVGASHRGQRLLGRPIKSGDDGRAFQPAVRVLSFSPDPSCP
jgi:hypothetical protein